MDIENLLVGIDDIATKLNINSRSRLQTYYDAVLQPRETLELDIDGFTNAPIQLDSEVEFAEAKQYLRGMATYVDNESPVLPRGGKAELSTWKTAIPTQRRVVKRDKTDYKRMLLAAEKEAVNGVLIGKSASESVWNYIHNNLYEDLKVIPDSHVASKNYQVGQMLSRRKLSLTADNNPGGIKGIEFEARVPDENIITEKLFTVAADGSVTYEATVDPILLFKKKIRAIKLDPYRGYRNVRVEMNAKTFFTLIEHPIILQRIGWSLIGRQYEFMEGKATDKAKAQSAGAEALLSNEDAYAINWFKSAIGADEIKLHSSVVGVEFLNSVDKLFETKEVYTFDEGVVVIRPTGNVGIIQPVMVVRPDKQAVYANILDGWGIIEYFYNPRTRTQEWISEVSYLAMLNRPRDMYYYNIQGEATTGASETTKP